MRISGNREAGDVDEKIANVKREKKKRIGSAQ